MLNLYSPQLYTDTSQVVELLLETSKVVHTQEPYVTEYTCYREINFKNGEEDIVMFERLSMTPYPSSVISD